MAWGANVELKKEERVLLKDILKREIALQENEVKAAQRQGAVPYTSNLWHRLVLLNEIKNKME